MTTSPTASPPLQLTVALPTRRATRQLARHLSTVVRPGDLVILKGPLGAGKTFLVRALSRALGLPESEPVTSPTFALVQELATPKLSVVHADLYRLNNASELNELGLLAAREGNLVIVEWGEAYIDGLGGDALLIELYRTPREAKLSATGPSATQRLSDLMKRCT
jgi:tRNA threonylcarbamoyladenosine biosynthesis protein TsaE